MNETELVKGCLKNNRESQKGLYELFYAKMLGVCLRYAKNDDEAKEMINEGFLYVFNELKNYKPNENFEIWIKNTIIVACISFLKKNRENMIVSTVYANKTTATTKTAEELSLDEIEYKANSEVVLKAIQELAPAYRKVYNLSVIEGFQHAQISEILNISEETSAQTLDKARFYLYKNIKQLITGVDAK
jgi:RNA polymerase sigma-70 factor (ECF subfamily)